jgi:hypothetical protein
MHLELLVTELLEAKEQQLPHKAAVVEAERELREVMDLLV